MEDKMIIDINIQKPKICATSEVQEIAKQAVNDTIGVLQKKIKREANDLCELLDTVKDLF